MEAENPGIAEGTGPAAESNEHDYAHTADPPEPKPNEALQPPELELSAPALGAEVDCPGGAEPEPAGAEPEPAGSCAEPVQRGQPPRSKRPEDRNCCCCGLQFQRQGRSFNRRAVHTFTNPDTVRWVFPDSVVHEKSFLCENCAQNIRSKTKRKQSGRRSLWVKPPEPKKEKPLPPRRMGKKSKAALLIGKSSYKAALQMLWSSKGARRPMMEFWSKQLRNEMKALSRMPDSPFHQKVSGRKPLSSFPWRRCLSWAQENAPLVTACLSSMFPNMKTLYKSSHPLTEEQAEALLERRTVVALSIPLFTRNIWRNNFLQAALGGELRLQGCTGSALDTLNTMGLCQNKDTVRLLVHRLQNGRDADGDQALMLKHEQMKADMGQETTDEDEEAEEEEEDEEEEEEEEEVTEEGMMMAVEEEVEQEEVQDGLQVVEEEEDDPGVMEKEEKRRRRKAKKQRREEKRKERRGKRKERGQEEEDDELEQSKRKVVVVRLGLLKGTSEVGRSDLSAP